ncbi:MAG: GGDEF domain-containing protein [Gemmatimonadetes bacterium]|jgi:diguanylate cyclase (GGDEF)-like protein|nr:GGDEF domain-containing protein [Gemmatimonadota bacterium]
MTVELPVSTPELEETLRRDRESLVRDALLWQRWVRYAGLLALVVLALVLGERANRDMLMPVVAVALAYVLCVAITGEQVRRAITVHRNVPALLVTADVLALASLVWLTGSPAVAARLLVGALLIVQLAVFYFGRTLGIYAAAISGMAYLFVARVLPPQASGAAPTLRDVAFTVGLFALVSAVLISAYGSFRERMNRLRLFCKLVEDGDLHPMLDLGVDKRPDDLTLLAQSFDAMRERLGEQIGTDPLTGCLNRRALETRLRAELRQAKRRANTLAILAIDLDHFKEINDTHGHPFGDLVLTDLAGIMRMTARDTDAVARLGGDEFIVVLPDTGWEGALIFAERMRRRVDEHTFASPKASMRLTISVGVALARGTDAISPAQLLQEADQSLYKAKSAGRNRVFA